MRQTKLEQAVQTVMLDPRNQATFVWYFEDIMYGPQEQYYGLYLNVAELRFERFSNADSIPQGYYQLVSRAGAQLSGDDLLAYVAGKYTRNDFGYIELWDSVYHELTDYLDSIGEYDD